MDEKSSNKFFIEIDTLKDRVSAKLDKFIRKPSNERNVLNNPNDAIQAITGVQGDIIEKYSEEILSKKLLDVIDKNLRNNIPHHRYEMVKNFKDDTEWIKIVHSIYILIRILKPSTILETGVGEIGLSTTFILSALQTNNNGTLYSIDPDKFYDIYGYHVGGGIPENLRTRHKLIKGKSQQTMKELLEKIGSIDIFLHDGDHRYKTKLFEYELAYTYMNKHAGIILSDDTWDSAFDFFTNEHKLSPYSIKYDGNDYFSYVHLSPPSI